MKYLRTALGMLAISALLPLISSVPTASPGPEKKAPILSYEGSPSAIDKRNTPPVQFKQAAEVCPPLNFTENWTGPNTFYAMFFDIDPNAPADMILGWASWHNSQNLAKVTLDYFDEIAQKWEVLLTWKNEALMPCNISGPPGHVQADGLHCGQQQPCQFPVYPWLYPRKLSSDTLNPLRNVSDKRTLINEKHRSLPHGLDVKFPQATREALHSLDC